MRNLTVLAFLLITSFSFLSFTPAKRLAYGDVGGRWHGVRQVQTSSRPLPDSIQFDFHNDGTVVFKHHLAERNEPGNGVFTFSKNVLTVTIYKSPFKHSFQGTMDNNGNINGVFTSIRENDPSQPRPYNPGTDTGTFTISRN